MTFIEDAAKIGNAQARQIDRVGSFDPNDEAHVADLASTVAGGVGGRAGPQAVADSNAQQQRAALDSMSSGQFHPIQVPFEPGMQPAPRDPGFFPEGSVGAQAQMSPEEALANKHEALMLAIFGEDPTSLPPDELLHRSNVFSAIMGAQDSLTAAETARTDDIEARRRAPIEEAIRWTLEGVSPGIISELTTLPVEMIAGILDLEAEGLTPDEIAETLVANTENLNAQRELEITNLVNPRTGNTFAPRLSAESAAQQPGGVSDQAALQEIVTHPDFDEMVRVATEMIQNEGASEIDVMTELRLSSEARDAQGFPLPQGFNNLIMNMVRDMMNQQFNDEVVNQGTITRAEKAEALARTP